MFNPSIAMFALVLIIAGGGWFENATETGWVLLVFILIRAAIQVACEKE
jgi:hypothetical protein